MTPLDIQTHCVVPEGATALYCTYTIYTSSEAGFPENTTFFHYQDIDANDMADGQSCALLYEEEQLVGSIIFDPSGLPYRRG